MGNFDKLPKLMYKKNLDELCKREKEDKLTSEDVDDRIDALKWITDVWSSKEFQDFKNPHTEGETEKDEKGKIGIK